MMMEREELRTMCELEDYAHFRAELVELSPESFTLEELKEILDDMIRGKTAIENNLREHFATLGDRANAASRHAWNQRIQRSRLVEQTAHGWAHPQRFSDHLRQPET